MVNGNRNARSKWTAFAAVLLMAAAAFGAAAAVAEAHDSDASASTYTFSNVPEKITPYPGDVIKITGVSKCSSASFASLSGDTLTITVPQSADNDISNPFIRIWNTSGNSKFIFLKMSEHFGASKLIRYHPDGSTTYIVNGATASLAPYHDIVEEEELDVEGYVTSVTSGYGLTVNGGALTGTISAPAGTMISVTWHQECHSGSEETGDFTFKIYVVGKSPGGVIAVPDQSVAAGGSVTISTGVPGVTVTGQDWLHVSSTGRIYGTAPEAPGSYKATAHYGDQSDEFTITVVSALTFVSTPSAGAFAYEG